MKIDLKQLSGAKTGKIPFSETIDLSGEMLYGEKPFQNPVKMEGFVSNETGELRLTGAVETIYKTSCARCLKPLEEFITAHVDTILTTDQDAEDDDEVFVVQSDSLNPADVFVSALFLQIPMTYYCKEDCKGICPHCGANRNVTSCDCDKKQIDPRFAALRALLDSKEEE